MVTVQFLVNGEPLKESQWPAVPQVADMIVMSDRPGGPFEVMEIEWDDRGPDSIARIHLRTGKLYADRRRDAI